MRTHLYGLYRRKSETVGEEMAILAVFQRGCYECNFERGIRLSAASRRENYTGTKKEKRDELHAVVRRV